ncbi:glycosyltransferase family 4 protein [Paludibacter sp.]
MKILQINNRHLRKGGADIVYLNTGQLLEELNYEVCYFSIKTTQNEPSKFNKYFIEQRVNVNASFWDKIKNTFYYFYNKDAARNLDLLIREEKPDIAHIHLYVGGLTSSIFKALKKHKIPVVYTAHDYRLVCPAYAFLDAKGIICEDCKGKYFYKCTLKRCSKNNSLQSFIMSLEMYYRNLFFNPIKMIDGFVFVSDFAYKKHLQYMPKLHGKHVIRLYNYSNTTKPKNLQSDYFLYYGRLSDEKGILTLIQAMEQLDSCSLKIVGDGPSFNQLQNYCTEYNIKNIEFTGYLKGDKLTSHIKNAKFIIVPSEWYENNPLTIIEAYSYGKPVIGSSVGGIPEIIINKETGFLFEMGDVTDLTDKLNIAQNISEEQYKLMCHNAFTFAEKYFNKDINLIKLVDFYNLVIKDYNEKHS